MHLTPKPIVPPVADVEFLASAQYTARTVTLDADTVAADSNGDKILRAGTVLGRITASGQYGPYDDAAGDGRDVAVGILLTTVNLRHGDAVVAMMDSGVVHEARLIGLDANAKADLANHFIFR